MENISNPWGEKNTNDENVTKYHDCWETSTKPTCTTQLKEKQNTMLGQNK